VSELERGDRAVPRAGQNGERDQRAVPPFDLIGDLKGKAHFEWRPEGIVCEIIIQA